MKTLKRHYLVVAAGLIVFGGLMMLALNEGANVPIATATNYPQELIQGDDILAGSGWEYVAGVSKEASKLRISPLNRKIVNQDGSGGQANPPVALTAPHLGVNGNFSLTATLEGVDNGATLQLYGDVPLVYDEWRYERPSVRLNLTPTRIAVDVWDGSSSQAIESKVFATPLDNTLTLVLTTQGNRLLIRVGDHAVGEVNLYNVLSTHRLWFGFDAANAPGWALTSLHKVGAVNIMAPPAMAMAHNDATAWRNLSAASGRHLAIGAAVALAPLQTDMEYRQLAIGQYSMWTTENELKAQFIHPEADIYSFQEADALVDTALANDISVHGHALVFGEANPLWMQTTPKDQLRQVMIDHITTVAGHFKARISEWDVVNEPLSDDDDRAFRANIWFNAMGKDYIAAAFTAAHAADPNAKLYINEFGLEADGERWNTLFNLVKELKQAGVPIDGVGFQAHVYERGDEVDQAVLRRHIQQLAAIGVSSRISELDVHGDDEEHQADQYAAILRACLAETYCTAYSMWGITDKYGSTTEINAYPLEFGDDLPWDVDIEPKMLVDQLTATLQNAP